MRAVLCKAYGPPESLVVEDVDVPACGPHAVRVAVAAASVNFPDVLMIAGKYQFQPPFPFSPGGELAGEIVEVGAKVEGLAVGDRVLAVTGFGAFAEQVVVPAAKCFAIPDEMPMQVAAAFGMTYGTSYHALVQRGHLREGETLVVHGACGGVGTAAVEIGLKLGARVVATGGSADKLARLREVYPIADVLDYGTEPDLKAALKRVAGPHGADVIYDPVGGPLFEPSLRCLAWEGRLLVVGFASGEIPAAKANLLLLKGSAVVGVFWGAFATRDAATNAANFAQLFSWYREGALKPLVARTYPLEQTASAISALVDREVVGKVVVTMR